MFVHHNISVYSVVFVNVMFFMQWLGSKMSESSQDGSCNDITAQVITGVPSKDDRSNLQGTLLSLIKVFHPSLILTQ